MIAIMLFAGLSSGLTAKEIHVAKNKSGASDVNPGTQKRPLKTIQAAAELAVAGDQVIIHQGIYREHVSPVNSGWDEKKIIIYRGAKDEKVIVSGAEIWQTMFKSYKLSGLTTSVWQAALPDKLFTYNFPTKNHNPFIIEALPIYCMGYKKGNKKGTSFKEKYKLCRPLKKNEPLRRTSGMVIYKGEPLRQCFSEKDMMRSGGRYFVSRDGKSIIFRLPGDVAPKIGELQLAVREQVFAPKKSGLRFIKLQNLTFEYAANDMPYPVNGMVSTSSGRFWIFEDCTFKYANTIGLDIGMGYWIERFDKPWSSVKYDPKARMNFDNIIRNCRFIKNGTNGLFAYLGISHHRESYDKVPFGSVLIEGSSFYGNNLQGMYRMKEAAIKLLAAANILIRGNNISHNSSMGIWLDVCYTNLRITRNLITDNRINGIFCEAVPGICLIDNNIITNTVGHEVITSRGVGVYQHQSSNIIIAQNLIANNVNSGVKMVLHSKAKNGLFHKSFCQVSYNDVLNNIFYGNGLYAVGFPVKSELSKGNSLSGNVFWGSQALPRFEINRCPLKMKDFIALQKSWYHNKPNLEKPPFYNKWQQGFSYNTPGAVMTGPLVTLDFFEKYYNSKGNYIMPMQLVGLDHNYWLKFNFNKTAYKKGKVIGKSFGDLETINTTLPQDVKYDYFGNKRSSENNHPGPFVNLKSYNDGPKGWVDVLLWPNPGAIKIAPEKDMLSLQDVPNNLNLPKATFKQ